jgi:hypothetical protein
MENLAAELAKDLHRHEDAILAADSDSSVNHSVPQPYDIHTGEVFDFDLAQHRKNPCAKAIS